jgi:hypothetical protein
VTGDSKGLIRFWRLSTNLRFGKDVKVGAPICRMEIHRPSSLLALALSDFTIEVTDGVIYAVRQILVKIVLYDTRCRTP